MGKTDRYSYTHKKKESPCSYNIIGAIECTVNGRYDISTAIY